MNQLPAPLYALVIEGDVKTTKFGKYFLRLTLKSSVGLLRAVMWDATEHAFEDQKFPNMNDILEITGLKDQREEKGSIVIEGFNKIKKEGVPPYALNIFDVPRASEDDLKRVLSTISDDTCWEKKANHRFTMDCFSKLDFGKLKLCPAGSRVHHSYQGGLLIHTGEVLDLCKAIVSAMGKYQFFSRDVLFSSAILHDLGKVYTYQINDNGFAETLPEEYAHGHLFYGMHLVRSVFERTKISVEKEFVNEVLHCISSHHGELQYGSIKTVQSVEAGILSKMDFISARNGMLDAELDRMAASGVELKSALNIYDERYFLSTGIKKYYQKLK